MRNNMLYFMMIVLLWNINQLWAHDMAQFQSHQAQHSFAWRQVQEKAKDTVVQIFVQAGIFNWLQPFKSPDFKQTFGTGFFIDDQGHIVSNFHVVEQAQGIKIQIPSLGKEQFEVEVVGVCPDRDLALLKLTDYSYENIKKHLGKIPFLELGDSDTIVRTQEILALGYPLKQEKVKSTQGIVSGREIVWGESYIQITAALNPGNSGGPSLNIEGKVIGINTARMPTAQNIGCIFPINDVKGTLNDLRKHKLLKSPQLGWEFNNATPQMMQFLKNPLYGGLYISRVFKNTLLDRSEVKSGDTIYMINGHKLDLFGETNVDWSEDKVPVVALLNRFTLGQRIEVVFFRNGIKHESSFIFEPVEDLPIRRYYPGYENIDYEIVSGMVIMPLTLNHIDKFCDERIKISKNLVKYEKKENQYEPRLIVTHIFPISQAQEARCINPGDLLSEVNGQPIATLDDLRKAVKKSLHDKDLKGFLTFKTEDQKFMVLSFDQVIKDEQRLAQRYMYHQTKLMSELQSMVRFEKNSLQI